MLIELKEDTVDEMFRKMIVEDWKRVKQEIRRLKEHDSLLPFQREDLEYNKKIKKAYERIIRYNHTHDEAEEIIGKKEKL